jgi:hypothetical protein
MASTRVSRNEVDPQGNRRTFTLSQWIKRTELGVEGAIFCHRYTNAYYFHIRFNTDDTLKIQEYSNSSQTLNLETSRRFRDTNAWYHIVLAMDTTQATDTNRMKLYVNGVQETSFGGANYPSQNLDVIIDGGSGYASHYGDRGDGAMYFGGVISHAHYTQGTAYDASAFGETDSTTGEWKIKTSPSVTYGTKGYFIFKDGNSVTDQSGNSNNFSVAAGTFTNTEDCPSNVFATLNPLHPSLNTSRSFSNGNTYVALGGTARVPEVSTLGMTSGKFYAEMKDISGSGGASIVGITSKLYRANATDWLGSQTEDYSYYGSAGDKANNSSETSYGNSFTDGDIIGVAVDLDNLKIYFSKNGVWQNSGDPTSGSTGTGAAFTITAPSSTTDGAYFFACSDDNAFAERRMAWNFGNGYFQTTAVASAGTNASNIGIFEYDVPTGYTALSTKGLNE